MKPLVMNQRVLTWLCVFPMHESAAMKEKLTCIVFSIGVILTIFSGLIGSVIFFLKFVSTDLEESLYALFQIAAIFSTSNAIVVAVQMRHRIPTMFKNLTTIYEKCKLKLNSIRLFVAIEFLPKEGTIQKYHVQMTWKVKLSFFFF